jgi:transcriptional regulator with XRE-family HTH domain
MEVEVTMPKTFGQVIADRRGERGLSVYALAQRAGLSDQAIHDLEHSDRQPSLDTARRLAVALGVSLDWLAGQLPPLDMPAAQPGRPRGRPKKASAATNNKPKRPPGRPKKGA